MTGKYFILYKENLKNFNNDDLNLKEQSYSQDLPPDVLEKNHYFTTQIEAEEKDNFNESNSIINPDLDSLNYLISEPNLADNYRIQSDVNKEKTLKYNKKEGKFFFENDKKITSKEINNNISFSKTIDFSRTNKQKVDSILNKKEFENSNLIKKESNNKIANFKPILSNSKPENSFFYQRNSFNHNQKIENQDNLQEITSIKEFKNEKILLNKNSLIPLKIPIKKLISKSGKKDNDIEILKTFENVDTNISRKKIIKPNVKLNSGFEKG